MHASINMLILLGCVWLVGHQNRQYTVPISIKIVVVRVVLLLIMALRYLLSTFFQRGPQGPLVVSLVNIVDNSSGLAIRPSRFRSTVSHPQLVAEA